MCFQQFLGATTASTFVISLEFYRDELHDRVEEFKLENAKTNELLAARNAQVQNESDVHHVQIVRHPSGADAIMRECIEKRAYYENMCTDGNPVKQVISIGWPLLTIG